MRRTWMRSAACCLVLAAAVVAVFGAARSYSLVWDDGIHLIGNVEMLPGHPVGIKRFWLAPYQELYIPLTYTLWALVARIGVDPAAPMLDPAPFHVLNLGVHAANAMLVFLLLRRLRARHVAATIGALLFALHPLQVESVAWVSGLKDLLFAFFGLASILMYLEVSRRGRRSTAAPWYVVATLTFVAALLSKPTAVMIPLVALACAWLYRGRMQRTDLLLGPWLALSAGLTLLTRGVQPIKDVVDVAWWQRPLVAADAAWFYLRQLVLPLHLSADYGRAPQVALASWVPYLGLAVGLGLLVVAWQCRKRAPMATAAIVIFVVALAPNLGLVPFAFQTYSTVADRYAYLALLGPALLLGALAGRSSDKNAAPAALALAVVTIFAVRSQAQVPAWKDSRSLWSHTLSVSPDSYLANNNLATVLESSAESLPYYRRAFELRPQNRKGLNNLVAALVDTQHIDEARRYIDLAVDRHVADAPVMWAAAAISWLDGDREDALRLTAAAVKRDPLFTRAWLDRAAWLHEMGDEKGSIDHLRNAVAADPDKAEPHFRLGAALAAQGEVDEARAQLETAVRQEPEHEGARAALGALAVAAARPKGEAYQR